MNWPEKNRNIDILARTLLQNREGVLSDSANGCDEMVEGTSLDKIPRTGYQKES